MFYDHLHGWQGFYEEVATPLLTDVQLNYTGTANLTQASFRHYYNGSEIVVAGQITDNSLESLKVDIIAISVRPNPTQNSTVWLFLGGYCCFWVEIVCF